MPVIETMITGVSFAPGYPDVLLDAERLHAALGKLPAGLQRDYANEYDRYAIAVYLPNTTERIGWIPAHIARKIAPILDSGRRVEAVVYRIGHPAGWPDKIGASITVRWAA